MPSGKATEDYNLKIDNPKLAAEWHPTKNGTLTPEDLKPHSNKKIWWKCPICGYEYQASLTNRNKNNGTGCRRCAGKDVIIGKNDLATFRPQLAQEWHPTKNGELKPSDVTVYSHKKVWWKCPFGHEWPATIASRSSGRNCKKCSNIGTSFPEQTIFYYIKQKFSDAVNSFNDMGFELDIYIPSITTGIEYDGIWAHKSKAQLKRDNAKDTQCRTRNIRIIRIRENGLDETIYAECIIMESNNSYEDLQASILKLFNLLNIFDCNDIIIENDYSAIIHQYYEYIKKGNLRSQYPLIAAEWHPTENDTLTPDMVTSRSGMKVKWLCPKGHEYSASPANRNKGKGCPICSNQLIVPGINDFGTKRPDLIKEWDFNKNKLNPYTLAPNSEKKVYWICPKGHEYTAKICKRNQGTGCPYCSHHRLLPGNDLQTLYPDLMPQWDYEKNNKLGLDPSELSIKSNKKPYWKCPYCGYQWRSYIYARTKPNSTCKCPKCRK